MEFDAPDLYDRLERSGPAEWDEAGLGLIAMNKEGDVLRYNAHESKLAGLSEATVLGRHFFTDVAPCTNNFLIASRYEEDEELDEVVDYVFTVRMKARAVKLRMLKKADSETMYLVVKD
ncbi:MAG: hypothetical protein ACFB6R_02130 [Alphaproteobacteria bacterium]